MRTLAAACMAAALLVGLHAHRVHGGSRRRPGPSERRPSTSPSSPTAWTTRGTSPRRPTARCCSTSAAGGLTAVLPDGTVQHRCAADFGDLFARGETGLMGLVLDPGSTPTAASTPARASPAAAGVDRRHRLDRLRRLAQRHPRRRPALGDIPVNQDSGRHGGCRLRFDPDGALLISTGDNAVGTNPQDRPRCAGKVLRSTRPPAADRGSRRPVSRTSHVRPPQRAGPGRPAGHAADLRGRAGHLPGRRGEPAAGGRQLRLRPGRAAASYDESVPMTDTGIPGAIAAVWSSGPADHRHLRRHVPRRRPVGRLRRPAAARRPQGRGRARARG